MDDPLLKAIKDNNVMQCKDLISQGAALTRHASNIPHLQAAVEVSSTDVLVLLLQSGAKTLNSIRLPEKDLHNFQRSQENIDKLLILLQWGFDKKQMQLPVDDIYDELFKVWENKTQLQLKCEIAKTKHLNSSSLTLICEFTAQTFKPYIAWYRDDKLVAFYAGGLAGDGKGSSTNDTRFKIRTTINSSIFIVTHLGNEDIGAYKCIVKSGECVESRINVTDRDISRVKSQSSVSSDEASISADTSDGSTNSKTKPERVEELKPELKSTSNDDKNVASKAVEINSAKSKTDVTHSRIHPQTSVPTGNSIDSFLELSTVTQYESLTHVQDKPKNSSNSSQLDENSEHQSFTALSDDRTIADQHSNPQNTKDECSYEPSFIVLPSHDVEVKSYPNLDSQRNEEESKFETDDELLPENTNCEKSFIILPPDFVQAQTGQNASNDKLYSIKATNPPKTLAENDDSRASVRLSSHSKTTTHPFQIIKHISNNNVIFMQTAYLRCKFESQYSDINVAWYHDGTRVVNSDRTEILTTGTVSALTIFEAQLSDQGQYMCVIQRGGVSMESQAYLSVTAAVNDVNQEQCTPLSLLAEKSLEDTPQKIKEDIQSDFKKFGDQITTKLNDNIENKMAELSDKLIGRLGDEADEMKLLINCIAAEMQQNSATVTQEVGQMISLTNEQFVKMNKTSEFNQYVYFKVFELVAAKVGSQVGLWKKLGQVLLQNLPPSYARKTMAEIKNGHTTEEKKAFDVLVYWRTFTVTNDLQSLTEALTAVGVPSINAEINIIADAYQLNKDRGHTGTLTEGNLSLFAADIGDEWERLGLQLNFTKARVEHFRSDHCDTKTAITWMLVEWRNRTAGSVEEKIQLLKMALTACEREDLCCKVHS